MERNGENTIPPDLAVEGCGQRQIGTTSDMSGLTRHDSRDLAQNDEFVSTGPWVSESMSKEWTDEKHSLYLNFLEASFVRQLYKRKLRSMELLGQHSRMENLQDPNSSQPSHANNNIPPSQFKVLQRGCWQKINLKRAQPKLDTIDASHVIPENQWIRHFWPAGKPRELIISNLEENGAQRSESILSGTQKMMSCAAEISAKKLPAFHSLSCHQDSFGINTGSFLPELVLAEVSDQNFVNEDYEGKQLSSLHKKKRTSPDILIKDQVVPIKKKSPYESHASLEKDGVCCDQQSENMDSHARP